MSASTFDDRVSVLVPAYNAAVTLKATLRSIAGQTVRPLEVIIVDDGSTDDTVEVARSFSKRLPNLRVISTANCGVSRARNTAMAASSGEFVATLDSDDIWHPLYLERMLGRLDACPDAGLVYCFFHRVNSRGNILPPWSYISREGWTFYQILLRNFVACGSTTVFRRSLLDRVGPYDTSFAVCEDFHHLARCAWISPIAHVPETLVGYRSRTGSLSQQDRNICESRLLVLRRLASELPGLNRKILRLALAEAHRTFAKRMIKHAFGRRVEANLHWLRAVLLDPVRTFAALLDETFPKIEAEKPIFALLRLPFLEVEPASPSDMNVPPDVHELLSVAVPYDQLHGRLDDGSSASLAPEARRQPA
jgi:hypothetical protein